MKFDPVEEGMSIVLLGSFNPGIFQPFWFVTQELLMKKEAEDVKTELIAEGISIFQTDRFKFICDLSRLQISTENNAAYEQICDLIISIFQILSHTPVTKLGINFDYHIKIESEKKLNDIGDIIAPKQIWEKVLETPKTLNVTIQGKQTRDYSGNVNVKVQGSPKVNPGIWININDHYDLESNEPLERCQKALEILGRLFEESLKRSKKIAMTIVNKI